MHLMRIMDFFIVNFNALFIMEGRTMGKLSKFIGNKAFYKMVLLIAVPIMIQNGITNFVSLLDNIMI